MRAITLGNSLHEMELYHLIEREALTPTELRASPLVARVLLDGCLPNGLGSPKLVFSLFKQDLRFIGTTGFVRMRREVFKQHGALMEAAHRAPDCFFGCLVQCCFQALSREGVSGVAPETRKPMVPDTEKGAVAFGTGKQRCVSPICCTPPDYGSSPSAISVSILSRSGMIRRSLLRSDWVRRTRRGAI